MSARLASRLSFAAVILTLMVGGTNGVAGLSAAALAESVPDLGSAVNFVALGGSALSSAGVSELAGSVGVSPGSSLTGFPPGTYTGGLHAADAVAATAHNDLVQAYDSVDTRQSSGVVAGDLAGRTLTAGTYSASAAVALSSILTLDAQNDPRALFIFQITGAFNAAAGSTVRLVNGAQVDHVIWAVRGAVTIGAGSTFVGIILALDAVTAGAGVSVVGRILSINGAVSLSSNDINPIAPVSLGTAAGYSVLAATSVTNAGASTFSADVGVSPGSLITGFPPGLSAGQLHSNDAAANQAQVDLHLAYGDAASRTANGVLAAVPAQPRLTGGVYRSAGSVALAGSLTFDGQNNANSIFIVQINGDLSLGAASRILLVNRADSARIFWQVSGTTTLGSNATFVGAVLSKGAITMRSGVQLNGRMLCLDDAVVATTAAASTLAPVLLGAAENFSVLAATSVSNTGPTVLNLSVGVSPGTTISGFPPGTTTGGSLHRGDGDAAAARAGALAAYTDAASRTRTQSVAGDLGGMTLRSGVYGSAAALALTGTLILNGQNDPNSVFIIQIGAAFTSAAGSTIQLTNGAQYSRVFWQVVGAASLGASSTFVGNLVGSGAVSGGEGLTLTGRIISLDGTVALSSNAVASPVPDAGTLSMTSSDTTLQPVALDGTGTQSSTGTSEGWSVVDQRSSASGWTLTVSATDLRSAAGTVDTVERKISAAAVSVTPGTIQALDGAAPPGGISGYPIHLSSAPTVLLSAPVQGAGSYFFKPVFVLTVPAAAFRSNFAGALNSSPLNPYVTVLTITIF